MRTKNIGTLYGAFIPNPWNFPDSMTMLRILTFTLIPSSFFSDHCVKLYGYIEILIYDHKNIFLVFLFQIR